MFWIPQSLRCCYGLGQSLCFCRRFPQGVYNFRCSWNGIPETNNIIVLNMCLNFQKIMFFCIGKNKKYYNLKLNNYCIQNIISSGIIFNAFDVSNLLMSLTTERSMLMYSILFYTSTFRIWLWSQNLYD